MESGIDPNLQESDRQGSDGEGSERDRREARESQKALKRQARKAQKQELRAKKKIAKKNAKKMEKQLGRLCRRRRSARIAARIASRSQVDSNQSGPESPEVDRSRLESPEVVGSRPQSSGVVHSRSESPEVVGSRPQLSGVTAAGVASHSGPESPESRPKIKINVEKFGIVAARLKKWNNDHKSNIWPSNRGGRRLFWQF